MTEEASITIGEPGRFETGEELLFKKVKELEARVKDTEAALELQTSINAQVIANLKLLLSDSGKKGNALILPPRLQ